MMIPPNRFCLVLTLVFAAPLGSPAAAPSTILSPDQQLRAFRLAEGYEINLFASEADGVAEPICMRWDERGRLWVLTTPLYPQIEPGHVANDKLLIVEDTDGDGRADRTSVFAEGLNMPEGFALGGGGVYLGEGTDLLHLKDTDGDGRADSRELVLSGFGTGDTHHLINNFTWGPGGELFFSQGWSIYSRVETPWGLETLDTAGLWRFRPLRQRLDPFFGNDQPPHNPWGLLFDDWGQPILLSGNGHGNFWMTPAMIRHSDKVPLPHLWYRQKVAGGEFLGGAHFGEDTADLIVTGSFLDNTVILYRWEDDGERFRMTELPPLLVCGDRNFRPIDVQKGPDGALYIADWYNPIIGHYQASYRHPDRDKTHGRIWRVTRAGQPLLKAPDLAAMNLSDLADQLRSAERWDRYHAKRLLAEADRDAVVAAMDGWVAALDPADPRHERLLFEAIGVYESHEVVRADLLAKLVHASEPRARAYAARVIGNWQDRLAAPLDLLARLVEDPNPRVRLEAVVSCTYLPSPRAVEVAARALDHPMDEFLDYALQHAVHTLFPQWLGALLDGKLDFGGNARHMAFLLRTDGSEFVAGRVRRMLSDGGLGEPDRRALLGALAARGGSGDMRRLLLDPLADAALLHEIAEASEVRKVRPVGDVADRLSRLLGSGDEELRRAAARLIGVWGVEALAPAIRAIAKADGESGAVRAAAIRALPGVAGRDALDDLGAIAAGTDTALWPAVVAAAYDIDPNEGAKQAAPLIDRAGGDELLSALLRPFLYRSDGPSILGAALAREGLSADLARRIRTQLAALGTNNEGINRVLDEAMGLTVTQPTEYDEDWVRALAAEVRAAGDPARGRQVFLSPLLNCVACHKVEGAGGELGPDLSAVGRSIPIDLMIEDVIWPQRRVKEGFLSVIVYMKDGRVLQGYKQTESATELVIRDIVSKTDLRLAVGDIAARNSAGTMMPPGLTMNLSREELRDLIRYLAELGGSGGPPAGAASP